MGPGQNQQADCYTDPRLNLSAAAFAELLCCIAGWHRCLKCYKKLQEAATIEGIEETLFKTWSPAE